MELWCETRPACHEFMLRKEEDDNNNSSSSNNNNNNGCMKVQNNGLRGGTLFWIVRDVDHVIDSLKAKAVDSGSPQNLTSKVYEVSFFLA